MALLRLRRTPKKDTSIVGRIKNKSWGQSRSYLFEYGFMLLLVGILNVLLISMFKAVVSATTSGVDAPSGSFGQSTVILSAVIVVLPMLVVLIQRTAASERLNLAIKNTGWRKAFLGIFLAATSVAALITGIIFVNSLVGPLANLNLGTDEFDWRTSLSGLFSAALLTLTVLVFAGDYRFLKADGSAKWRHYYRYSVVAMTALVTAVFILWPMCEQRKVQVDDAIVGDLFAIQAKVAEYEQENAQVPESLSDLKLESQIQKRADKYDYAYERSGETKSKYTLCAVFKTDASKRVPDYGGVRPLPAIMGSMIKTEPAIYPDYGNERNPYNHKAGHDCFEFTSKFGIEPAFGAVAEDLYRGESAPAPAPDMPSIMPLPVFEQ